MIDADIQDLCRRYSAEGHAARAAGDRKAMKAIAGTLKHLQVYGEAWGLMADLHALTHPGGLPDWRGEDIRDGVLLVDRQIPHAGAELRMARFIAPAARHARETIVATEARFVPLLARSFPEATIVPADDPALYAHATHRASYERLGQLFGSSEGDIVANHRSLIPPPDVLGRLRACRPAGKPVVGIAWYSSNDVKSLPTLPDWAGFLASFDAHYVSLQYREADSGIDALRRMSCRDIAGCDGIDQIEDMDSFAAQVASVDLVVTITNTTRHMAGALDTPCIVILDDAKSRWHSRTPLYPKSEIVHRAGRPWSAVFEDARGLAGEVLAST